MVALVEPEVRQLQLSPTQWAFLNDPRRFVAFVSGRGCGKSTVAALKLLTMCQSEEYQGARFIVWGPTYPQLKHGTMVTFDDWFHRADMIVDKINGNEPERRLKNDITVLFRNASNPDQTRGHEYAGGWMDEAGQMDESVFRLTNAATRQRRADGTFYPRKLLITTTPRGKNWIYKYFKDTSSPKYLGDENCAHYETNTLEAMKWGIAADDYVQNMGYVEGTMEYEQEVLGRYVSWGGNVFYAFDERRHYDKTYAPPSFERVRGGIDIGQSAPTAITVTGVTAGGKFITFKEFYQRNAPPHIWMPMAKRMQDDFGVETFDVDSAFPAEIRTLRNMGVRARPSMKAQDAAGTAVGFINGLFQQDRLVLMAVPNLRREIESYEVKEVLSGDEVTFLDKVKPNQDDHCLVAGTPVITDQGERPIEQIAVGDRVLTRTGFQRVQRAAMTNPAADVFDVVLSSGATIRGTGNHPFWVVGKGWVRLDALTHGDTLLSWQSVLSSMELPSVAIPSRRGGPTPCTTRLGLLTGSEGLVGSTRKSGSRFMAPSLTDVTSIISTSTRSTMTQQISCASRLPSITPSMPREESCHRQRSTISTASATSRKRGMRRTLGEHGIEKTGSDNGRSASLKSVRAISAETFTPHLGCVPSSAPTNASLRHDEPPESMTRRVPVLCAESSSPSTGTASTGHAPVHVVAVSPVPEPHPVYNLSVAESPEFFAHGVLVHNSIDSWRYHLLPLSARSPASYGKEVRFSIG